MIVNTEHRCCSIPNQQLVQSLGDPFEPQIFGTLVYHNPGTQTIMPLHDDWEPGWHPRWAPSSGAARQRLRALRALRCTAAGGQVATRGGNTVMAHRVCPCPEAVAHS